MEICQTPAKCVRRVGLMATWEAAEGTALYANAKTVRGWIRLAGRAIHRTAFFLETPLMFRKIIRAGSEHRTVLFPRI
jgi:hypothetical protein